MDLTHPGRSLAVGHPARQTTRTALLWTLGAVVAFSLFAFVSTQDKALRAHSPWQDDPYDVVVSFTMFLVPLIAGAAFVRAQLCRANRPLIASRLLDLQRAADASIAAIALTVLVDWAAVLVGENASVWGTSGVLLIAALGLLTLAVLGALLATIRSHRVVARARVRTAPSDPDWCDDALELVLLVGDRLGPVAPLVRRVAVAVRAHALDGRWGLRRHRLAGAFLAAVSFGVLLAVAQGIGEASADVSFRQALVFGLLFATIGSAGMFAALVAVGSYLRVIRPSSPHQPPAHPHMVRASLAAAASVPVTVAFRDHLGWLTSYAALNQPVAQAALLIASGALLVGVLTLAGSRITGRRNATPR